MTPHSAGEPDVRAIRERLRLGRYYFAPGVHKDIAALLAALDAATEAQALLQTMLDEEIGAHNRAKEAQAQQQVSCLCCYERGCGAGCRCHPKEPR